MSTSSDSAFRLRMGAPDRMLITFDGPLRPLGAWLQAIFEARHAASTKVWAKAVEGCHTIGDLRDVMARRVPPPTADYYFGGATTRSRWATMKGPFKRCASIRAWA